MSNATTEPREGGDKQTEISDEDNLMNELSKVTEAASATILNTSASLGETTMDLVQARILYVLSIYPRLSMSMLQIGIGTGIPPAIWHPALDTLIAERRVKSHYVKASNPVTGREQAHRVIQLEVAEPEAA